MKQKAFFIIFEGLSLKQIKKIFEGESPILNYCISPHQTYFSETFTALIFSQTTEINNQSSRKDKTKEDNTSYLQ